MNGPLKSLCDQLGKPKVNEVPAWIVQNAIDLRTSLSEMVDNANAVLKDPSQPIPQPNMKDLNDSIKKAARQEVLIKTLLHQLENV